MNQREVLIPYLLLLDFQLLLNLRQLPVLELRRLIQVILSLGQLNLLVQLLDLLPQLRQLLHRILLILPLYLLTAEGLPQLRQLPLQSFQTILAQLVGLLL